MENIKNARKALGIKQCFIARKIGMSKSNYCNIENGNRATERLSKTYTEKAKEVLIPIIDEKIRKSQRVIEALVNLKNTLQ